MYLLGVIIGYSIRPNFMVHVVLKEPKMLGKLHVSTGLYLEVHENVATLEVEVYSL